MEDLFVVDGLSRIQAWRLCGNTEITVLYTNDFEEMLKYFRATSEELGIPVPSRILSTYTDIADIGTKWSTHRRGEIAFGKTKQALMKSTRNRTGRRAASSRDAFLSAITLDTRRDWWLGDYMDVTNIVSRLPKQIRPQAQELLKLIDTGGIGPAGVRNAVRELRDTLDPIEWQNSIRLREIRAEKRVKHRESRAGRAQAESELRESSLSATPLSQLVASMEGIAQAAKAIPIPNGITVKQAEVLSARLFTARSEIGRLITKLNKIRKA